MALHLLETWCFPQGVEQFRQGGEPGYIGAGLDDLELLMGKQQHGCQDILFGIHALVPVVRVVRRQHEILCQYLVQTSGLIYEKKNERVSTIHCSMGILISGKT